MCSSEYFCRVPFRGPFSRRRPPLPPPRLQLIESMDDAMSELKVQWKIDEEKIVLLNFSRVCVCVCVRGKN